MPPLKRSTCATQRGLLAAETLTSAAKVDPAVATSKAAAASRRTTLIEALPLFGPTPTALYFGSVGPGAWFGQRGAAPSEDRAPTESWWPFTFAASRPRSRSAKYIYLAQNIRLKQTLV